MTESPVVQESAESSTLWLSKHQSAADVANDTLRYLIGCIQPQQNEIKAERDIQTLCKMGDAYIEQAVTKMFSKKKIKKGIAFPTAISLNEVACHFCPFPEDSMIIQNGDLVKIELGCHIDGYISVVTHSLVVGASETCKIEGAKALALEAAWTAAEVALTQFKIGKKNTDVTSIIQKCMADFQCNILSGIETYQIKQNCIEDEKSVVTRDNPDAKVEEFEFKANDVYGLDIVVSTGEGRARNSELRTTIYRRNMQTDDPPSKNSPLYRTFMGEVQKKFGPHAFTIRSIEEQRACKIGLHISLQHDLVCAYPVLTEKTSDMVARFKCTVIILPDGTKKISGLPFTQAAYLHAPHKIADPDVIACLEERKLQDNKKNMMLTTEFIEYGLLHQENEEIR